MISIVKVVFNFLLIIVLHMISIAAFQDHPCDHPIIILDGLGWQVVVSLLHFMYCGEVVVEEELLPNLLNAATNLNVTGLTHVTSAIISAQVSNPIDIILFLICVDRNVWFYYFIS